MLQRTHQLAGIIVLFLVTCAAVHAQDENAQVWTASGGEARLELRADFLTDYGLEITADGQRVTRVVETRRDLGSGDRLALEAPYGNFERFRSGDLFLDTGWVLRHRGQEVRLDGLTLTPGIGGNGHPVLEARDAQGRHLLTFSHLHILARHEQGLLTIHNGDIVATRQLARLLDLEALAGLPMGMAWLDLDLRVPAGADVSGGGESCEDRPFWPQEGHPVDVGLTEIGTVAYQGTDTETGKIKVAPSATLKNLAQGDVPWIANFTTLSSYPYIPEDQHPFLVWNLYRVVDGRIEQIAASGTKHAFVTLNMNCDINCGSSNVLWPGCEDVYSSGNNDSNFRLGPRDEIEASLGLFFSTCSFFDPNCTGDQTNSSGTFENRLMVHPDELETPGAEYFLDAWYVVQFDTDIWNSMGYHAVTPEPVGDGWSFGLGPFTEGRAIDEWVGAEERGGTAWHAAVMVPAADPDAPYPEGMPQGHIRVLVQVTEVESGRYRYNYAVQNFDFDRGVESFQVPIPEGAQVFETWFGDVDDDAANDWTAATGDGFVSFQAPEDNPLPWFTLFNFEIETDAPPVESLVTLGLGGDAVTPEASATILGPRAMPNLRVIPSELDFGEQPAGVTSPPQTATLNNTGPIAATALEFPSPGNGFAVDASDCGATLPSASTCELSVTFTPPGDGPVDSTLTVGSAEGASAFLDMAGTGFATPDLAFDPSSRDFGDVPVGSTAGPLTALLQNTGTAEATELSFTGPSGDFDADTSACGTTLAPGADCQVSVTYSPTQEGNFISRVRAETTDGILSDLDLAGTGVPSDIEFTPVTLAVDAAPLSSDGNGVFEPGETVAMAPTWENAGGFPQPLTGTASGFAGPGGATYTLVETAADYGEVPAGSDASCEATGSCYELSVDDPADRPATHWDAAVDEALSDGGARTWTLHIGDSFTDVPRSSGFYPWIETVLHEGVTAGCGPETYCPSEATQRNQMAVFVLKALEGEGYTPPACTDGSEVFGDVPFDNPFCGWIEELATRGVTSGCGGGNYCPNDPVSRDQMAVFLLKTLEGDGYSPPACTGDFGDVACPSPFADWIEELAARGITAGCGGGNYCPGDSVTRDQMAVFLGATFGLAMYAP